MAHGVSPVFPEKEPVFEALKAVLKAVPKETRLSAFGCGSAGFMASTLLWGSDQVHCIGQLSGVMYLGREKIQLPKLSLWVEYGESPRSGLKLADYAGTESFVLSFVLSFAISCQSLEFA